MASHPTLCHPSASCLDFFARPPQRWGPIYYRSITLLMAVVVPFVGIIIQKPLLPWNDWITYLTRILCPDSARLPITVPDWIIWKDASIHPEEFAPSLYAVSYRTTSSSFVGRQRLPWKGLKKRRGGPSRINCWSHPAQQHILFPYTHTHITFSNINYKPVSHPIPTMKEKATTTLLYLSV